MRILITNNSLDARAGSELYVRDLAIELMRRGHSPVAYSTQLGAVAANLRAATIPVIDRLESLGEPPDIIHGHHHYETFTALLRFPNTPAIYYCHGWLPWQEAALHHPNILRYVAVDDLCRERLISECGIDPADIEVIFNFFDQRRFPPRSPLPPAPRRALAFGNYFSANNGLPALREACARYGIELDAHGISNGNPSAEPGPLLAGYDIVFAKARSAIEALAVGPAVILATPESLGPMVRAENFDSLRRLNFGVRTLDQPLTVDRISAELRRYDAADAHHVSQTLRAAAEMQPAVDRIVDLYHRVLAAHSGPPGSHPSAAGAESARYLERWALRYKEHFQLSQDRDLWAQRCRIAEQALADFTGRAHETQLVSEDRQRWIDRCLAAEQALDARSRELQLVSEDRQRWIDRCLAAEESLAQSTRELGSSLSRQEQLVERATAADVARAQQGNTLRELETRAAGLQRLLEERDADAAQLARELHAVRSSATWRWTQTILRSAPARLLFGGWIRSVAAAHAHPRTAPDSLLPEPGALAALQSRADRMIVENGFLGVPRETFSEAGRQQIAALLAEGLRPESNVLEFGCGCLRIAYWLVRYLQAGRYHGIEPARARVELGLRYLFTTDDVRLKHPRFDYNPNFDSSGFHTKFDFFLARSIWTHAAKSQIEATLDSFVRDSAPSATFLSSYLPAQSPNEDYQGSTWVGTSHESATPGCIRHALPWILAQCHSRGLTCDEVPGMDCDSQYWLRIRRQTPRKSPSQTSPF